MIRLTRQILGAEHSKVRNPNINTQLLVDHINAIRQNPHFRHAVAVIGPESNLGAVADLVNNDLMHRKFSEYVIINMGGRDGSSMSYLPGVYTSNETKINISATLKSHIDNNAYVPWASFISVGGVNYNGMSLKERTAAGLDVWRELLTQYMGFMSVIKPPIRDGSLPRMQLRGGQGADDLVMAAQMSEATRSAFKAMPTLFLNTKYAHTTRMEKTRDADLNMADMLPWLRKFRFALPTFA